MTQPLEGPPADWAARAGAWSIDVLFGLTAMVCLLLVGWSAPPGGWLWWSCTVTGALVFLAVALNRLLYPAVTGRSLGRAVFGVAVVDKDGARVGPWRLLGREVAHLLDCLPLFLGWLWPLVDTRGRTFADIVARTEVRQDIRGRVDRPMRATAAVAGAAVLAAGAAAVGYLGIDRPDSAASQARQQIAVAGPKIVTDMLSYTAATVAEDFAHDQTLVTDAYRPLLAEQQDAVREAGPVDNDYWATNSAVLSATADRASMLVLLQGQRGTGKTQRLITASVRVEFARNPSGQWLVDDLSVLSPARPPAGDSAPAKPTGTPSAPPPNGGGR